MCLSGKGIESPSQGQLSAASRATLRCLHSTTRHPQPAVTMQHRGARRCSADHCWRALHRVTGGTDPCACKGVRAYPPGGHMPLGSGCKRLHRACTALRRARNPLFLDSTERAHPTSRPPDPVGEVRPLAAPTTAVLYGFIDYQARIRLIIGKGTQAGRLHPRSFIG